MSFRIIWLLVLHSMAQNNQRFPALWATPHYVSWYWLVPKGCPALFRGGPSFVGLYTDIKSNVNLNFFSPIGRLSRQKFQLGLVDFVDFSFVYPLSFFVVHESLSVFMVVCFMILSILMARCWLQSAYSRSVAGFFEKVVTCIQNGTKLS